MAAKIKYLEEELLPKLRAEYEERVRERKYCLSTKKRTGFSGTMNDENRCRVPFTDTERLI